MENIKQLLANLSLPDLQAALSGRADVRLLRLLTTVQLSPLPPEEPGHLVILDTEATGKDAAKDELIELGMLKVLFCKRSLRLCGIVERFNELRDPGMPIPPEASAVNHITDDMVAGKSINFDAVATFIEDADLVIAHNAEYDRPLVERCCPEFASKAWACSLREIDWSGLGIGGGKLDYIAFKLGFFFEGHRAVVDCEALLEVLASLVDGEEGPTTPFKLLMSQCQEESSRVYAFGSPFDKKDVLKGRGYRWHPGDNAPEKSWFIAVQGAQALQEEFAWLRENVYNRRGFSPGVVRLDAFTRFSSRLPEVKREYL